MTTAPLLFENESVEEVQVVIRNAGDGLSDALKVSKKELHLGEEVAYILRGTVTGVQFKQKDEESPVARVHIIRTAGITEVDMDMAKTILAAAADNLARAKAEREGQLLIEADEDLEGKEAMATIDETGSLAPQFKGE